MFSDKLIFFADVHYKENKLNIIEYSMKYLKNYIIKTKPKFVVLGGDYFDKRINSDSLAYKTAINNLIEISKFTKYLIVYKGTHSHDADQLEILNSLNKIKSNIIYIDKFKTLNLDNLSFAIIPEEYPTNFDEYYNELYNNKFDFVFGHGMLEGAKIHDNIVNKFIKDIKFNHRAIEEKTQCKFNLWGHIHIPQKLSEKTYYVGSLARLNFGEEEPKRFLEIDIDNWELKSINSPTYQYLTFNKKDFYNNIDIIKELLKEDKVFIRIITPNIDNEIKQFETKYKDKIKILLTNNKEIINEIHNKDIIDKSIKEQYLFFLKKEIEKKTFTKKQKELLKKDNINSKLEELIKNCNL